MEIGVPSIRFLFLALFLPCLCELLWPKFYDCVVKIQQLSVPPCCTHLLSPSEAHFTSLDNVLEMPGVERSTTQRGRGRRGCLAEMEIEEKLFQTVIGSRQSVILSFFLVKVERG